MENDLFTINEFAKICQTTKDTLLVYDKKGLLKPAKIGENGYRYYHIRQNYDFCVIKAFQMIGSSLNEISEQLEQGENKNVIELLKSKKNDFFKRQLELIQMQMFIDEVIKQSEKIKANKNILHVEFQPEEYFISMPAEKETNLNDDFAYSFEALKKLNKYILERGYSSSVPLEMNHTIERDSFFKHNFRFTNYQYKVPFKVPDPFFKIKPAGKYASKYITGSASVFSSQCKIFMEDIISCGYKTTGDFYVYYPKYNLFSVSESENTCLISVRIEE
ncbi:MAG: MerR family transcriptional regulator [Oscillospiraceae bacterium]|nr:MerR family transcriptional regulator [Oscillospiraceae bacterium]